MKLYDIAKSLNTMAAEMEDAALDEQTIKDTLESSTELATFEDKAAAVLGYMQNTDGDIAKFDAEIKRLTERKRIMQANQDGLKKYLLSCMQAAGLKEVSAGVLTLKRQANPPAVEVEQGANLPAEYLRTTITQAPDKTAIKNALKSGVEIPGCRLVQGEKLVIK